LGIPGQELGTSSSRLWQDGIENKPTQGWASAKEQAVTVQLFQLVRSVAQLLLSEGEDEVTQAEEPVGPGTAAAAAADNLLDAGAGVAGQLRLGSGYGSEVVPVSLRKRSYQSRQSCAQGVSKARNTLDVAYVQHKPGESQRALYVLAVEAKAVATHHMNLLSSTETSKGERIRRNFHLGSMAQWRLLSKAACKLLNCNQRSNLVSSGNSSDADFAQLGERQTEVSFYARRQWAH